MPVVDLRIGQLSASRRKHCLSTSGEHRMSIRNIILGIAVAFFAFPVAAADIDASQVITVSGTGEVSVEPDEIVLQLLVEKFDRDLQTAKRMNDESVGGILALTRRFAIPPDSVQTNHISVEIIREQPPKLGYSSDDGSRRAGVVKGYMVSKTVTVKLTEVGEFETFYADILKTGVSEVTGVELGTSKLREHKDTARTMSMKAAREKAIAMAAAIGQTIGKAVRITEDQGMLYSGLTNSAATAGGFSGNASLFAPGAIKVKASVNVSFQLN
jgi:uncharacterized protein